MISIIEKAYSPTGNSKPVFDKVNKPVSVLNLFAYTGGATAACVSAGANVCHVDSAKNMTERAKENLRLSGLPYDKARFIVDDCKKFVLREIKRGKKYDAIIMDPPSYGRGPSGEMWKLEDKIFELVQATKDVLSDEPLFYLINSYTSGLQPTVMKNISEIVFADIPHSTEAYEIGIAERERPEIILPCGCSAFTVFKGAI
jgi:23S rRNA (cytosine1962-C5)-methyltransferase